jgi:hypothetical protein
VRLITLRCLAVFFALTWLVFPGFGLTDLSVTWDPDWPVVLEASWGVFMTVLVGGSFLAVAVRPRRSAPALVTLDVALATMLVAVAAGLEPQLLLYGGLLAVQRLAVWYLLADGERVRPLQPQPSWPLLAVAALGVVPWLVHAEWMFRSNRHGAGVIIGDLTMGVDHYSLQGALALALIALPLLAALWPRGRRHLGVSAGLCAAYLGLVSYASPGESWGSLSPTWSLLCLAWGLAVAALAVPGARVPRAAAEEVGEPAAVG